MARRGMSELDGGSGLVRRLGAVVEVVRGHTVRDIGREVVCPSSAVDTVVVVTARCGFNGRQRAGQWTDDGFKVVGSEDD